MDGWMDGRMDGRMDEWMDGRMYGWMDKWMNGWTDGWMNEIWIFELSPTLAAAASEYPGKMKYLLACEAATTPPMKFNAAVMMLNMPSWRGGGVGEDG